VTKELYWSVELTPLPLTHTYLQFFQLLPDAHWIALDLHRLGQICLTTT